MTWNIELNILIRTEQKALYNLKPDDIRILPADIIIIDSNALEANIDAIQSVNPYSIENFYSIQALFVS